MTCSPKATEVASTLQARTIVWVWTVLGCLALLSAGCSGTSVGSRQGDEGGEIVVPFTSAQFHVDGKLNEPCYRTAPPVDRFVTVGQPGKQAPATKAWLFWQRERLIFAFECADANIVAAKPSSNKHDVDGQDRIEVFLWSGRAEDPYYCAEIAAQGALHDYAARFYRRFDDAWSMPGLEYTSLRTPKGYCVEGTISRAGLEKMGFRLEGGARWRIGLFRAEFASPHGQPDWITWVDAKGPKPDFHVAESFGQCLLGPEKQ